MISSSKTFVLMAIDHSRDFFGTIGAGLQTIVGGNITLLTELCEKTRSQAFELMVQNARLLAYGLQPITLAEGLLLESAEIARRFAERADCEKIPCVSHWNAERAAAAAGGAGAAVAAE